MDIARASINKPVNTWIVILVCLIGGIWAFLTIGRLEDPEFTIKEAIVNTQYPGASAEEVELEVTETLETAIQEMAQIEEIRSKSVPGRSEITVEIRTEFGSEELPQIWDELRRKVNDAQGQLPPGARASSVNDDFGEVYGIFYAITAPGFSARELADTADFLRRELLTVEGVGKVATGGEQEERIYLEIPQERLVSLNIAPESLAQALEVQNAVADAGSIRIEDRRVRISPTGVFDSVEMIRNQWIGPGGDDGLVRIGDIARVVRAEAETPQSLVRFNGERAVTLGVAGMSGSNIVEVGRAVDARLAALDSEIPLGVEIAPIYDQPDVVADSVNGFLVNLAMSVSIVIAVLCLAMGWRPGLVVGLVLFLTVLGTLLFMRLAGIEIERISLGALIIAMGMLVDNAIVIVEGILVRMQRGVKALAAASETARSTQWPLLGATVIGIMAFSGIGLSPDATGEFLFSLFFVIATSLLLSWVLAISVAPLFSTYLLRGADAGGDDPYGKPLFRGFRRALHGALYVRWLVVIALIGLTVAAVIGFGYVRQGFFPNSATPIFYVDYRLPQGSDIRATERDMTALDGFIREQEGVADVSTFIGQGATRFMLTYAPQQPDPSYGQFIIRAGSVEQIPALADRIEQRIAERYPQAVSRVIRVVFGPGSGYKVEARFSGSDADELRRLAAEAERRFAQSGALAGIRTDWRSRELIIAPQFTEDRAQIAGVTRQEMADALLLATEGTNIGTYREGDDLIPILLRAPEGERQNPQRLRDRFVWSAARDAYIPVTQLVSGFDTRAENTLIYRRDRARTITVQADPADGFDTSEAFARVRPAIEAMDLPQGYALEWGGEFESSSEAQASLGAQLPLGFLIMVVISILLFAKVRQPLIIWLTVPMSICGVTVGLLVTGLPFGFMSLLGFLSLSGMLIKNAIVLIDEIDQQIAGGRDRLDAVLDASVSRVRPVSLAALTTILGMAPLLWDVFFADMAVTIMGGLAFATVLTLIAVPVLYAIFFRIRSRRREARAGA